jgi:glycine C-acetyltransferase
MYGSVKEALQQELDNIKEAGLYKSERIIVSPQAANIQINTGKEVLNFCANNYLGLSSHPEAIKGT